MMERIHSTRGLFRSQAIRKRGPRAAARTTCFEALESREVLDATFTIVNDSVGYAGGKFAWFDTQINVAIYGQDNSGANNYYFDTSGTPHLTTSIPKNGAGQQLIPNYTLNTFTKTALHTYSLPVPDMLPGSSYGPKSARIVFSLNKPLEIAVNADGTVTAPVPTESEFYDFVEYTYNAPNNPSGNLNINTSTIDQFGIPITVKVDTTSVGIDALRSYVIDEYTDFTSGANDPFAVSLWPTSDKNWGTYRITNPSDVMSDAGYASNKVHVETFLRKAISSTDTTLNVYDLGFPDGSSPFKVRIFQEVIQVTGVAKQRDGTVNWTVTRGVDGTTAAPHVQFALVKPVGKAINSTQTSLTVFNTLDFPTSYPFNVLVGSEIMTVTGEIGVNPGNQNVTWSVTRGQFDTTAVGHAQDELVIYEAVTELAYNSYFNEAIDALFTKYYNTGTKLELGYSPASGGTQVWEGEVMDNGSGLIVMRFSEQGVMGGTTFDIYYPFFNQNRYYWAGYTPQLPVGNAPTSEINAQISSLSPSEMVFACNGVFADNKYRPAGMYTADELKLLANLENQMVSALNRGVALLKGYDSTSSSDTWADSSKFYTTDQAYNRYAEFMHRTDISINGLAYGFAFDDQGGHASDIGVGSFSDVTITLGQWAQLSNRQLTGFFLAVNTLPSSNTTSTTPTSSTGASGSSTGTSFHNNSLQAALSLAASSLLSFRGTADNLGDDETDQRDIVDDLVDSTSSLELPALVHSLARGVKG